MHHRRNGQCPPLVGNGDCKDEQDATADTASVTVTASQTLSTSCGCYFSLACSIGSMSLACGSLWNIPNTTDRITLQRGLFLTSLGFIYFVSLTDFCNKYLLETKRGKQFRDKYRLMHLKQGSALTYLVGCYSAAAHVQYKLRSCDFCYGAVIPLLGEILVGADP
ncbi:hypothetical protein ACLKA6_001828 [Drosophila palustris]